MYVSYYGVGGLIVIVCWVYVYVEVIVGVLGDVLVYDKYFDMVLVWVFGCVDEVLVRVKVNGINLWCVDVDYVLVVCDEVIIDIYVVVVLDVFGVVVVVFVYMDIVMCILEFLMYLVFM